ncbi:hypothetical protein CCR94_18575 [Rhodoblastus sphagnicola]|uniref:Uncharacterized protein n=2 Tax=Rhodoblastus sphagnicola TaxID=333368 RepID=A0A2S6N0P0_9HYPH|nr:hypothetical protein CCR94_18575 [Rhodoblastus sphagnicola]
MARLAGLGSTQPRRQGSFEGRMSVMLEYLLYGALITFFAGLTAVLFGAGYMLYQCGVSAMEDRNDDIARRRLS